MHLFKWLRLGQKHKQPENKDVVFDTLPSLLTIDKVSEIFKVHANTLRNWDRTGKLKAIRIGVRKDRRYEKEAVIKLYNKLSYLKDDKPSTQKKKPKDKLPRPEVSKYVIQPEWSMAKIKLLLISKRFSVYVYSVALVAFAFLTVQVTFFTYIYVLQAEEKPLEIHQFKLEPGKISGWQGANQAKGIDLLSTSGAEEFTDKNSAIFHNKSITKTEGTEVTEQPVDSQEPEFTATGYKLPKESPSGGIVKEANIVISMSADTYEGNEDVVSLSYSIEPDIWVPLESFALIEVKSNATNQGFWTYPIEITEQTTPEDIENISIKVAYDAVPGEQESTTYIDGVALDLVIEEPLPIAEEIEASVNLPKEDYSGEEDPIIEVEIEDTNFLGIGNKERTIKSVEITDPQGNIVEEENYKVKDAVIDDIIQTEFTIDTKKIKKPGKYTITMEIEQEGETKIVTRDFTWGVLVINTMKSVYRPAENVHFGMGVLDSEGHTICDAELILDITSPDSTKTTLSTSGGTIIRSTECGPRTVTNIPDYSTDFVVGKIGDYTLTLTATTSAGDYTINDTIHVQNDIAFDIIRLGPTRIYPLANYEMFLEVTPAADYKGVFEEFLPDSFEIISANENGIVSTFDPTTKVIRWQVDWQAGQPYTLSYEMNPPDISPELFLLGPAKVGNFSELRQWQIASDYIPYACVATSSGNWNAPIWATCGLGGPGATGAGDSVTINSSVTVTLNVTPANSISTLTLNDPGKNSNALNFNAGTSLTTTGAVTLTTSTNTGTVTVAVGSATFNPASIAIGGGASGASTVSVSTGTMTVGGSITFSGTAANARLTTTSSGTIYIAGSLGSSGTLASGTGTIRFNGSSAQTLGVYTTYNNVRIDNSSGGVTLTGTTTIGGTLTVVTGTLDIGAYTLTVTGTSSITGTLTISSTTGTKTFGDITINDGGVMSFSAAEAVTMNGNLANNGTFSGTTGVWTFQKSGGGGTVSGTGGITIDTATFNQTYTNNGTLTASTALSGSSTLTNGATGTLNIGGTSAITGLTASDSGNTVNYTGGAQTVKVVTYHHLGLSGSSTKTMTSVATVNGNLTMSGSAAATTDALATVGGNIALSGTATLTLGTVALVTVTGDITVGTGTTLTANVSTTVNGGDITVTSTGAMTTSASTPTLTVAAGGSTGITGDGNITLYALTISGSGTLIYSASGTNTINNNVTVAASTTLDIRSTMAITGNITNTTTGIIDSTTGTPTVTVSGATIGGGSGNVTFYNLTKSGAGSTTFSGGTTNTIKNNLTISAGTLVAPSALAIGGSFDNSAAFTHSSGTLTFNATSIGKTIAAGASQLNNVTFNGVTGGWSFTTATTTLAGDLTVTNGTLSGTTNITVNGGDITCGLTCGSVSLTGGTTTLAGTGNFGTAALASNWTFSSLTFSGSPTATTAQGTGTITISSVLTVGASHTLNAGAKTYTLTGTGTPFVIGALGTFAGDTSTFKYTGAGATNIAPSTGYNNLEILPGAISAIHTMKAGTFTIGGNLTLGDGSYTSTTITAGGVENPTISVVGNLELCASPCTNNVTFTKSSSTFTLKPTVTKTWTDNNSVKQDLGTVSIASGALTPKIQLSTAVKATGIAVAAGHELALNSQDLTLSGALTTATSGTITCASCNAGTVTARTTLGGGAGAITFYNLTLDAATTLSSSFTVLNNLSLPASVTAGSTTITMTGTAGAITGGGATLNNLTIDPSSAGTITLNSSDLTVSSTLNVASGDALSISSGRMMTVASTGTLTLDGTISGAGTLSYQSTTTLPTSGTISSVLRFDSTAGGGNVVPARTYGGNVEFYNNAASGSYQVSLGTAVSQTINFSGNVTLNANNAANLTVSGVSNNPAINITGDVDYTGGGAGTEGIQTGTGIWTVSGGTIDFTGGIFTAAAGNTFRTNNAGVSLTTAGQTFQNYEVTGGVTVPLDAMDVNGTFTVTAGTFRAHDTANLNVAGNFTIQNVAVFDNADSTGKLILDGDLQFADNTSPQQDLGALEIGTSPDTTTLTSDLKATSLAVKSLDILITDGYDLDIGTGGIAIEGTLNATRGTDAETTINNEGNWTMNSGGAFTYDNSTVTLDGAASKNIAGTAGTTFYNLTITTGDAVITASDHTVTGTLNVDTLRTLTINVSRTLTLNSTGSLTLSGIITGAGRLTYKPSAAFPTGGTISSILRFDATDNNQTMSNRTYGGAVELYNTTAATTRTVSGAAGTITLSSSVTLTQTGGKSAIWDLNTSDPSVTVTGAVTIGSGTELSAPSSSILDLKGNYTNSGNFTDNLGTVRASGTSQQTFSGSMTGLGDFRSLTVTNAGAANPDVIFAAAATVNTFTATTASSQIQFLAGANYTFTNISLNGQAVGTRVTLSSSAASQWNLIVSGTQAVSYVSVSYSNACLGNNIAAYDGTNNDGLNNNCWDFTNLINVTGVLYDTTRSTPYNCATDPGTPITISISTSGRAAETTTCTLSNGTFSFTNVTGPLVAGDPVIVYVDSGETPQSTTVTRGSGPFDDIIGIDMYQNDVIVRHEDAGPTTNANLSSGDNGDAGIRYSVATNNLTVDSGLNLYVWGGDTYDPGGTVTTQGTTDFYIGAGATASLDTATNTISDDIDNYGTLSITATTNVTNNVYVRASSTLNSSAATTMNGDAYVYGDLNVTAGTFTVGDGLVEDLILYTGGTFDPSGGTTAIQDDFWIGTGGTATITSIVTVGGLVNVDAGALNINTGADVDIDEHIDQDGGTITINDGAVNLNTTGVATSYVYVDNATFNVAGGTLTVGASTADAFQVNSGGVVGFNGGTVNITGAFDANGGTTTIANTVNVTGLSTYSLDQDGGTVNINTGADVNLGYRLSIDGSGSILNLNDGALDAGSYWNLNEGTVNLNGGAHTVGTDARLNLAYSVAGSKSNILNFNMTAGTITTPNLYVYDTHTLNISGSGAGGTIIMGDVASGTRNIYDASTDTHSFNNITIAENAEIHATSTVAVPVAKTFNISTGKIFDANTEAMTVGSALTTGTSSWDNDGTFTYDTSSITVLGGDIGGSADTTFYDLTIGDGTTTKTIAVNGTDDPTVTNALTVDTGDILSISSSRTVSHTGAAMTLSGTIAGAGTMRFTDTSSGPGATGTLSSIVRYDASSGDVASTTFDARTYGGVVEIFANSGTARNVVFASGTYNFSAQLYVLADGTQNVVLTGATNNPTINITGDLDYTGIGAGWEVVNSGTGTWTVSGNVDFVGGTYNASAGNTLKMNGSLKTVTSFGQTLQNFEVSGGSISNIDNLDVNGNFTVSGGGFSQGTNVNITIAGNMSLSASTTFTKASGSGTITFDGTTAATYIDSNGTAQNIGDVIFNKTSGVGAQDKVTLSSDMTVDTADIQTGDTLDLASGSYTLTLANAGATATALTVTGTLTPGTSTVKYLATNSGGNINVTTTTYSSLQLSGAETYDLTGHLTGGNGLSGSLTIDNGATLDVTASNYNMDVAGDWANNGSFTDQAGTVTLDGTGLQQLSGTLTGATNQFYNLTVTNASASGVDFNASAQTANTFTAVTASTKLTFEASATYTFQNINWNGQAVGTRVDLNSSSPGTQWNLVVSGTQTVLNVDAQDSYACGGNNIDASGAGNNNSGNNECWLFGVTLSGTLYKNETGTTYNCTIAGDDNQTVAVSVGGAAKDTGTCTAVGGTFSINIKSPASAGTPIVIFIDDEVVGEGTVVTRAASATASISGLNVYKDVVALRHEDAGPITNANLDTADSAFDDDIKYTVTTNNLTVISNFELHIGNGKTFDPGGTVTTQGTGSLHLDDSSTMYIDTDTSTVANNITIDTGANLSIDLSRSLTLTTGKTLTLTGQITGAGTLIYQPSTAFPTTGVISSILRFDSSSNDQIVSARTYGGDVEIYNTEVATGTKTTTLGTGASQTVSISGNLTLTEAGTRDINLTGATYNPAVNVTGNISYTAAGGSELITSGTGVWTVTGNIDFAGGAYTASSGNTIKMNGTTKTITSNSQVLQNFQVDNGSGTISNVDALNLDGNFYISKGAFTQGANVNINVGGNFTIDNLYTFTKASGSGVLVFDENVVKGIIDSTSPLQDLGNVQVIDGIKDLATNMKATSLLVNGGATMRQEGFDIDIGGDITLNNGALWPTTGSNVNLEGSLTIGVSGTYNIDTASTTTFDGTSGTVNIVTDSLCSLCNLTNVVINDGGGTLTVNVQDPLVILGDLTITGGTLDVVDLESNQINVGGSWSNSDIFTARSGTVVFDAGSSGKTINPGSSSFYDLTFNGSGGAWSPLTNTVTVTNDLIMTAGTFDTSSGTADVTVNGNVQCLTTCGTVNMTSTNTFTQSVGANKNFGTNVAVATNWTFYNLTLESSSGGPTITINGTGTGEINVLNNLIIQKLIVGLTVDNETNDRILDVDGYVWIGFGTVFQASSTATFTVGGDWINDGQFQAGSGTVIADGNGQQTFSGLLTGANRQFNNLTITNAGAANPDVIFAASAQTAGTFLANTASTQLQFLAGGTYTFQNINFNGQATGTRVALRSSSTDTQWNINVAGSRSVSNTDVQDSYACGQAPDIDASDGTNYNSQNNNCWIFDSMSVTLSPNSIDLGTLSTSLVSQDGVTLTVSTNAANGYTATVYYDTTLDNGIGDTIADTTGGTIVAGTEEFGAASSRSGYTIGQWGNLPDPAACADTGYDSNATALSTSPQTFAGATGQVTSHATTLCFLASITGLTEPGSYEDTITVVATGLF
ncbi:MAG: hypothetical protein Q8O87_00770 [bacterium]|nr:hypothetical protein [bacterium]